MTAVVICKPQPEHGCDLCPFPVRHMARVRIIDPFGAQHRTDINLCWPCFENWLEDSLHAPLTQLDEKRPTPPAPALQYRGPFAISGNYWHRTPEETEER